MSGFVHTGVNLQLFCTAVFRSTSTKVPRCCKCFTIYSEIWCTFTNSHSTLPVFFRQMFVELHIFVIFLAMSSKQEEEEDIFLSWPASYEVGTWTWMFVLIWYIKEMTGQGTTHPGFSLLYQLYQLTHLGPLCLSVVVLLGVIFLDECVYLLTKALKCISWCFWFLLFSLHCACCCHSMSPAVCHLLHVSVSVCVWLAACWRGTD